VSGAGSAPGAGGISRGRGDAALTYGNETAGATDQFEAQVLPDATTLDIEATGIIGIGTAPPSVAPTGGGAGLVDVDASAGKAAWKRRVAPHHREAVQGYFGTKKEDR